LKGRPWCFIPYEARRGGTLRYRLHGFLEMFLFRFSKQASKQASGFGFGFEMVNEVDAETSLWNMKQSFRFVLNLSVPCISRY
jgi:hypothetical protein